MNGLFETGAETFEVSQISSLQRVEGRPGRALHYIVRWKGGGATTSLLHHEYRNLLTRPQQVLPAEPGTRLVSIYPEDGTNAGFADVGPILAWALCLDGQLRPILPSGVRCGFDPESTTEWHPDYVRIADGSLFQFGCEADPDRFPDVAAVLAHENRRAEQHRVEQNERAAMRAAASKEPKLPQDGDPAAVFEAHARWVREMEATHG